MPGAGRVPKPPDQLRRRNKDVIPWRTVVADGEIRGPELPADALTPGQDWHPVTRRWWETWRCSPQAQIFIDTDWLYLLDTARLHHELWRGRWEFAAELRLRVAKLGATPVDRARLRVQIAVPGDVRREQPSSRKGAAPTGAKSPPYSPGERRPHIRSPKAASMPTMQ